MQREGISTLYIRGTPREPFCYVYVNAYFLRFGRLIGEMRKEFDFIAFGLDKVVDFMTTHLQGAMEKSEST